MNMKILKKSTKFTNWTTTKHFVSEKYKWKKNHRKLKQKNSGASKTLSETTKTTATHEMNPPIVWDDLKNILDDIECKVLD